MVPTIELRNAVVVGEPGDEVTQLLAAADGFEAVDRGTRGDLGDGLGWTGGVEDVTVVEALGGVEILPPADRRNEDENQEFRRVARSS